MVATHANAGNWLVTTPGDAAIDYDKICDSIHCSLRDAVWEANQNSGDDTIIVPANFVINVGPGSAAAEDTNATGDLDIWDTDTAPSTLTIRIDAPGLTPPVLHAAGPHRLFHVLPASGSGDLVSLVLDELVVQSGHEPTSSVPGGGCVANQDAGSVTVINTRLQYCMRDATSATSRGGGAIDSVGHVYVNNSEIWQNQTTNSHGGAIYASAGVSFDNSLLQGNRAIDGWGGGAWSGAGSTSVVQTTVNGNKAYGGGAFRVVGTLFTVSESRLTYNSTTDSEGGVASLFTDQVIIEDTDFGGNFAETDGGVLSILKPNGSAGPYTITRSSFWDNEASVASTSSFGGALVVNAGTAGTVGTFIVRNTTFSRNTCKNQGGAIAAIGDHLNYEVEHVTFYENGSTLGAQDLFLEGGTATLENNLSYTTTTTKNDCMTGTGAFVSNGGTWSWFPLAYSNCYSGGAGDTVNTATVGPETTAVYATGTTKVHKQQATSSFPDRATCITGVIEDQHKNIRPNPGPNCDLGALEEP